MYPWEWTVEGDTRRERRAVAAIWEMIMMI